MVNTEVGIQPAPANGKMQPSQAQNITQQEIAQFSPDLDIEVDKAALQSAPKSAINLCMEYHEFELGTPIRGIYIGCTPYRCANKQTGEEILLVGAVFVDENRNPKINCAVKFVQAISRFPLKTAFEVSLTKTKKTASGGNMQMFDIRMLNMAAQ